MNDDISAKLGRLDPKAWAFVVGMFLLTGWLEGAQPIYGPGSYPPGDYYLANDIVVTSGTALTFNAVEVKDRAEVNLNGKTIRCQGPDTIGIEGHGPSNLIIIGGGGSWIDGCRIGVSASRQTRVQEVIFTNIRYMAMDLSGPWSRVILNVVDGVRGVTDEAYSVAVNASGPNAIIRGNLFTNFYRQPGVPEWFVGEGVPIILNAAATGALVELNTLRNDVATTDTIGIWVGIGGGHTIRGNSVRNFHRGIVGNGTGLVEGNTVAMPFYLEGAIPLGVAYATEQDNTVVGYPVEP